MIRRGRRSGVYTVVAVHSTALGPALGGCRMWRYQSSADGARDALRLSRAMTFKAAAARVPLGGGKGVICAEPGPPPAGARRREVLLDFADTVNTLDGRYVTAEDVGTSARDMAVLAGGTTHVTGLARAKGGSGDPSPFTALGWRPRCGPAASGASAPPTCAAAPWPWWGWGEWGPSSRGGSRAPGPSSRWRTSTSAVRSLAKDLAGARWADPSTALLAEVDVLAPCALGGAVDEVTVGRIRRPGGVRLGEQPAGTRRACGGPGGGTACCTRPTSSPTPVG